MKHPNVKCAIGTLSNKGTGAKHYSPPRVQLDVPGRVTNAAMPNAQPGEITKIMTGVQRPGSDHRHLKSRGAGC